jgi:hypothetical protein
MPLVPGYYQSCGNQGRGSSMKNPISVSGEYCGQALSILSLASLLLFVGCSSIDGMAESHTVKANLVTRHVEPSQEEPEYRAVSPEPDYEWFY